MSDSRILLCVDDRMSHLTLGKRYEKLSGFFIKDVYFCTIYNDVHIIEDYPGDFFKTVEDIRNEKLNELGI
jgi:hypothetical protein